jgi:nucleoside-diphosphate-sugar epimerase
MASNRLFIFGLGDTASLLARLAQNQGYATAGTVRSVAKAHALRDLGHDVVVFEAGTRLVNPVGILAGATHLLCSIPPGDDGDPALKAHAADLVHAAGRLRWLGYLSTTGVYGDRAGAWIDETTPPAPASDRARRRLVAERQWQALGHRLGVPTHIFRLPGIYGPGRSALDQVRAGTAHRVVRPGQVFSRIHIDDAAATILASMAQPDGSPVYNVADDEPSPQADVVAYACELLGVVPPPLVDYGDVEASLSAMARSFYGESRRVKNDLIKNQLGVTLAHPTYRDGLRAILAAGG